MSFCRVKGIFWATWFFIVWNLWRYILFFWQNIGYSHHRSHHRFWHFFHKLCQWNQKLLQTYNLSVMGQIVWWRHYRIWPYLWNQSNLSVSYCRSWWWCRLLFVSRMKILGDWSRISGCIIFVIFCHCLYYQKIVLDTWSL